MLTVKLVIKKTTESGKSYFVVPYIGSIPFDRGYYVAKEGFQAELNLLPGMKLSGIDMCDKDGVLMTTKDGKHILQKLVVTF